MAVITFSRKFPGGHPKAGEPTFFVQQILNSLGIKINVAYFGWLVANNPHINEHLLHTFWTDLKNNPYDNVKRHTIRGGVSRKEGASFSPRVWLDRPYNSPQVKIAPEQRIKKLYPVNIGNEVIIYSGLKRLNTMEVSHNDGLTLKDFTNWFIPDAKKFKGFIGQIICWTEVNY